MRTVPFRKMRIYVVVISHYEIKGHLWVASWARTLFVFAQDSDLFEKVEPEFYAERTGPSVGVLDGVTQKNTLEDVLGVFNDDR